MRFPFRSFLKNVPVLSALLLPHIAFAKAYILENRIPRGQIYISPMLGATYRGALELGVLGSFLIIDHGFVPQINNSVHIEGGLFHDFVGDHLVGSALGRLRWDFHLHPQWSVFAAGQTTLFIGKHPDLRPFQFDVVVGGWYHLNESISLRAEVDEGIGNSYHSGMRVGASFRL